VDQQQKTRIWESESEKTELFQDVMPGINTSTVSNIGIFGTCANDRSYPRYIPLFQLLSCFTGAQYSHP